MLFFSLSETLPSTSPGSRVRWEGLLEETEAEGRERSALGPGDPGSTWTGSCGVGLWARWGLLGTEGGPQGPGCWELGAATQHLAVPGSPPRPPGRFL